MLIVTAEYMPKRCSAGHW